VPTYGWRPRFRRDFHQLSPEQQRAFLAVVRLFVEGLRQGRLDPRLRVKRVQGRPAAWEMSWAPDGRATFEYGEEVRPGEPHVIWRRVGTHEVFREP
jgi:hypothetical protein